MGDEEMTGATPMDLMQWQLEIYDERGMQFSRCIYMSDVPRLIDAARATFQVTQICLTVKPETIPLSWGRV
jgi:hypothetical protein